MRINNETIKTPSKITPTREVIWSQNTGRSTSGVMIGDIVAIKQKLQITWNWLTASELSTIYKLLDGNAFVPVSYINPKTDTEVTKTMYAGGFSMPAYSYSDGIKGYKDVSLNLIER